MTADVLEDGDGIPYLAVRLKPHENDIDEKIQKWLQAGGRISLYESDGIKTFMEKDPLGKPSGDFLFYILFR